MGDGVGKSFGVLLVPLLDGSPPSAPWEFFLARFTIARIAVVHTRRTIQKSKLDIYIDGSLADTGHLKYPQIPARCARFSIS